MIKSTLIRKVNLCLFHSLVMIVFISGISFSQTTKMSQITTNKYAAQNLGRSIQSDNPGVRKSAVYLAGQYMICESEDILIAQLKVEPEAEIRVLIGLVLFRINSDMGMKELYNLISTDENPEVRRMSSAILKAYLDSKLQRDDKG